MVKSQVVMLAGIAVVAAAFAGLFVPYLIDQASAQSANSNQTNTSPSGTNQTNVIPQLKGSVSIQNATNALVKSNIKVSFADAANTAKGQVTNGVVVGGQLSEVQGYLTYVFRVANYNAGTMKIVIVDAGNGKVLYTSNDLTLYNGGLGGGFGCGGGYGFRHHHFREGSEDMEGLNSGTTIPNSNNNNSNSGSTTGTTLAMPGPNF